MTLTLTDEEVVVYMTMKKTIEDMREKITLLEEYIAQLEEENVVTEHEWKEPTSTVDEIVSSILLNTPYKSNTSWTLAEEELIRYIFNHKGKYGDKPIEVAAAKFPGRTVGAVGTELRSYGFYTRKGLLKYPKSFQPKYKES